MRKENAGRRLIQVHDLGIPEEEFCDPAYLACKKLSTLQKRGIFALVIHCEFMRANTAQMGSEKPTMPVPNPGQLKGLLEQFYWHPNCHIAIDRYAVMNEVRIVDLVCNELETCATVRAVQKAQKMEESGLLVDFSVPDAEPRQQRSISYVRDQKYIVVARICKKNLPDDAEDIPPFSQKKVSQIFKRRVTLGQNQYHTYLGTKECLADVDLCTLDDLSAPSFYNGIRVQLGRMPYMADYRDPDRPVWYQFEPVMVNGTIVCPSEREVMGDAAYSVD